MTSFPCTVCNISCICDYLVQGDICQLPSSVSCRSSTSELHVIKLSIYLTAKARLLHTRFWRACCGVLCFSSWLATSSYTPGPIFLGSCSDLLIEVSILWVSPCLPLGYVDIPSPAGLQDWWTCTSFSTFYRKWNLLVHDWIKAYIYQDLKDVSRL